MEPSIEKPDIEQPQVEQEPEVKDEQVDIEGLMNQLEAAQVTDPEKLKGRLANAQAFDRVQSERDQISNELNALRQEVTSLKQPKAEPQYDYDGDAQPVDLEGAIYRVLDKRDRTAAQRNLEAQKAYISAYKKITGNPKYNLVKDQFEAKVSDPMTQFAISTGQVNPVEMFNEMLVGHYEGLAKQAVQAFKQIKGTGSVKPPHIESSDVRTPTSSGEIKTDKDKKIEQLRKRAALGQPVHEDEMDFVLDEALGDLFKE